MAAQKSKRKRGSTRASLAKAGLKGANKRGGIAMRALKGNGRRVTEDSKIRCGDGMGTGPGMVSSRRCRRGR